MKILVYVLIAPLLSKAQYVQDTMSHSALQSKVSNIRWSENLNWAQVKGKAREENKYIFLDCFATWCGPCKLMDKNVYVNDSVINYFNDMFISVKVQMDKTEKDNELVQSWYQDADTIAKKYHVKAYPTFIFLSPTGKTVHIESGYKSVNDFITLAKNATQPGKVYNDPYLNYDKLVVDFRRGIYHYDSMLYMIKNAWSFDTVLANQLIRNYTEYLAKLSPRERYTKESIEFWSLFTLNSTSKTFQYFLQDGDKIDEVIKQNGFASSMIDKTISYEIVIPFLNKQNKNPLVSVSGMYLGGEDLKPDYSEADWQGLGKIIRKKFTKEIARRNVLTARVDWYKRHRNKISFVKYSLLHFKRYPPITNLKKAIYINQVGWDAFLVVTDKKVLNEVIEYTEKELQNSPRFSYLLDTHANLLYKLGRTKEAIDWEEKAVEFADKPEVDDYKKALLQMRNGEPTNGIMPALSSE